MQAAVSSADDASIEAEKAKWPQIVSRNPDACNNKCRLCKAPAPTDRVCIAMAPGELSAGRDHWFSLCAACLPLLSEGAVAMVARLEAEVTERKARAAIAMSAKAQGERG